MNFIILMTSGLIGAVPMVVALLACIAGYVIVRRGRLDVVDSPWFWAFAFSTIGLLGVWAISNKYDDRQKRLEARYEARQRIAERPPQEDHRISNSDREGGEEVQRYAADEAPAVDQVGYPTNRHVPLRFLAAGLLVVSLGSAILLWRSATRSLPTR